MRFLTAIGVTVLVTGMIAPLAYAQNARVLPVFGTANRVERLPDDVTRLTGDVTIDNDTWQLNADQVEIFKDQWLVASGTVVFVSADGRIEAERVEFDMVAETGTFYGVSMKRPG